MYLIVLDTCVLDVLFWYCTDKRCHQWTCKTKQNYFVGLAISIWMSYVELTELIKRKYSVAVITQNPFISGLLIVMLIMLIKKNYKYTQSPATALGPSSFLSLFFTSSFIPSQSAQPRFSFHIQYIVTDCLIFRHRKILCFEGQ